MNISEIERKLVELDKNLHSILEMVRVARKPEEDIIESVAGAWEYDVDSVEFVRELRRRNRAERLLNCRYISFAENSRDCYNGP